MSGDCVPEGYVSESPVCLRLFISKKMARPITMRPAIAAITAAAMYPGDIPFVLDLPRRESEGDVGIEVTVWVIMLPPTVTTCTFVTGVGVHVEEDLGAKVLSGALVV